MSYTDYKSKKLRLPAFTEPNCPAFYPPPPSGSIGNYVCYYYTGIGNNFAAFDTFTDVAFSEGFFNDPATFHQNINMTGGGIKLIFVRWGKPYSYHGIWESTSEYLNFNSYPYTYTGNAPSWNWNGEAIPSQPVTNDLRGKLMLASRSAHYQDIIGNRRTFDPSKPITEKHLLQLGITSTANPCS